MQIRNNGNEQRPIMLLKLEVQMTTACNWENRVRREVRPILNDGAWIGGEVRSTPNGRVLPITGHVMHEHEYIARYERATYIWDTNGTQRREVVR